jgi:hypothetical protein
MNNLTNSIYFCLCRTASTMWLKGPHQWNTRFEEDIHVLRYRAYANNEKKLY